MATTECKPTFTCYMDCQMVYTNETIPGFGSEVIIASVFGVVSLQRERGDE